MDSLIFTQADIDKILNSLEEHLNKPDKINNGYELETYKNFLYFFRNFSEIDFYALSISSNYVCGTIPTTFSINNREIFFALRILNDKVLKNKELNDDDYLTLVRCMNNSIIATSKLLHLIRPGNYPVINSRIKNYFKLNNLLETVYKKTNSKEKEIQQYKLYRDICIKVISNDRFTGRLDFLAFSKMAEPDNYTSFKILEETFYYYSTNKIY